MLFLDYEKIPQEVVLQFKDIRIDGRQPIHKIYRISEGSFTFYQIEEDLLVVDVSKNGNLLDNLRAAMRYEHRYKAHHRGIDYLIVQPSDLGYDADLIWNDKD